MGGLNVTNGGVERHKWGGWTSQMGG